jgi:hypothetical protein
MKTTDEIIYESNEPLFFTAYTCPVGWGATKSERGNAAFSLLQERPSLVERQLIREG